MFSGIQTQTPDESFPFSEGQNIQSMQAGGQLEAGVSAAWVSIQRYNFPVSCCVHAHIQSPATFILKPISSPISPWHVRLLPIVCGCRVQRVFLCCTVPSGHGLERWQSWTQSQPETGGHRPSACNHPQRGGLWWPWAPLPASRSPSKQSASWEERTTGRVGRLSHCWVTKYTS